MSKVRSITPNEPANFTPEMGNYKTLQPFRYWCQKVLPLVYDDSLSYYEMCCKMLSKINEIVAAYNDNFSDMVKDEIINNLNKIMLELMYDEDAERITFFSDLVRLTNGTTHEYSYNDRTMTIK